ncbi:ArgP/LysG family DNA-binding transcriptional regulator [Corynebacterium sp. 13CS0277]|uniref:LysR family transcriptional regulator ArgP n=1 Tax=Corynebacterium sp. 13CS0277 TaxID=2071994 RepID=UPI000D032F13|nr:LysR family transcriptional regulator ArgP [Corynebacterium sp. 13CS0277]PRQ10758.1 ArgP/LysG family DNA-binding transcriptional regulator [Corynebacterium sp. 13CS0277]
MNPTHLATLLAVFDEGTFEGAADVLGITPSAVSQRIKALENHTGRVLVHRTQPATPTEAGEVLAQAARRMALLQAETDAQLRGRLADIPLSVAVNADSLATWFLPVIREVAAWDQASLRLRVEDESHSLKLLRRGDVLGVVTRESLAVSGCEVQPLGFMRYRALASPALKERYTRADGSIDWASMPALRFGPKDALQDNDLAGRVDTLPRHRRISQIPSSEGFVAAACMGLGWALIPDLQSDPLLARGDLVTLDERVEEVPLYWQHWRLESPLLSKLSAAVVAAAHVLQH